MNYRYYCHSRPPEFGAVPRDHSAVNHYGSRCAVTGLHDQRPMWGWVEYDHRLTFADIRNYELIPADQMEDDFYSIYQAVGYDVRETCLRIASWWAMLPPHAVYPWKLVEEGQAMLRIKAEFPSIVDAIARLGVYAGDADLIPFEKPDR